MPIDGVSFQNSGFNIQNPTEVNIQAEQTAQKEAQRKIKEPEKSDKAEADSEENEDNERDLQGRDSDEGCDDEENPQNEGKKEKKFLVKFNQATEMVEMIDAKTGEVMETLNPDDLLKLLSKSKAFSGVFVDRKI